MAAWLRSLALALICAAANAGAADRAQLDYQLHCQGCHTPNGSGYMGVPALENHVGTFLSIPGGRDYLVQVPGSATSALDDARLAAVLNWIVLRFARTSLPDSFRPYAAEEVARLRREPLNEVASIRQRLLARVPTTAAGAKP
ncbi:MAG: c-type cytochrome [Panacagrimonas sp.]